MRRDVAEVLLNLAREDRAELDATGCRDFADMFMNGLRSAQISGCVDSGGRAVSLFGCCPDTRIDGAGIPWMICTPEFRAHPREAMLLSKQVIDRMRAAFPYLHNLVHAEHATAIRWLRWLGFHVEPDQVGPNGAFRHFWSAHV